MSDTTNLYSVSAFEPEMVKCLCKAHDSVMHSLCEQRQGFTIEPEVVARHVISLAKRGISDHKSLCTRTLRVLSGRSGLSADPRPDDMEYLSYLRSTVQQTGQTISNSLALIDEHRAVMVRIDRQLNHSEPKTPGCASGP